MLSTRFASVILILPTIISGFCVSSRRSVSCSPLGQQKIKTDDVTTALFVDGGSNVNEVMPLQSGCTCAMITPFTPSGSLDISSLKSILQMHLDAQTDGLCVLGTTGEASLLSMGERETVLKTVVEEVKGKIPIMVGVGTIHPTKVKEMTMQAKDLGCDAALVVTPYYVKPPQRALVAHFETIADLGLPVVIYNVPGRTGVDFLPEGMASLADHESIVAVKDATGNLDRLQATKEACGDKLLLYSGDDSTSAEFAYQGGHGCISVTANVAPSQMKKLMSTALSGDLEHFKRLDAPLRLLHDKLFVETNPIPVKWAAMRAGRISSASLRPPLVELDQQFHYVVEEALRGAGLI